MGYSDELFADSEQSKLSMLGCPVCCQVLEAAMRVGCPSEHELCQGCWMSLTPVLKQSCPACTAKVALFTRPALSTRRLVDGLLVKCQQGVEGCGQTHLLSEREHHLQYECAQRLVKCTENCGAVFPAKQADDHLSTCPEALLECDVGGWQCEKIKRGNMAIHLLGCEHYKCAYTGQGCSFEGTCYDRDQHQSTYCAPLHRKLQDTSLELDAVSVDANDQVEALSAELLGAHDYIHTLEDEVKQLKSKLMSSTAEQVVASPSSSSSVTTSPDILTASPTPSASTPPPPFLHNYFPVTTDDARESFSLEAIEKFARRVVAEASHKRRRTE